LARWLVGRATNKGGNKTNKGGNETGNNRRRAILELRMRFKRKVNSQIGVAVRAINRDRRKLKSPEKNPGS
jgi:hypothetical protein